MLPTPAAYVNVWKKTSRKKIKSPTKKKKSEKGDAVWVCGGIRVGDIKQVAEAATVCGAELPPKKKNWMEKNSKSALVVRQIYLSTKKVKGDNKYPYDSSVPLQLQLKLTRGPDVEYQRHTQRWGAEAASTAWLNGPGDFPSPQLPSRHSQSLLGKSAAPACKLGNQWVEKAREGAGVYLEPCIIHMHRYGTKTSTKERPQVPSVPTCFQCIIDGNTTPYIFPWFTGFNHCFYNKGYFQ